MANKKIIKLKKQKEHVTEENEKIVLIGLRKNISRVLGVMENNRPNVCIASDTGRKL